MMNLQEFNSTVASNCSDQPNETIQNDMSTKMTNVQEFNTTVDSNNSDQPKETIEKEKHNPWSVNHIEDFLYFCCPECDERNHSEVLFMQHALDAHPKGELFECFVHL